MTSDEMFLRPAICRYCGAQVVDAEQHKAFHDGIVEAFEQIGKALERLAKPRGGAPKRRPRRDGLPPPTADAFIESLRELHRAATGCTSADLCQECRQALATEATK